MPHSKPAAALPMQLSVMLPQLFIQGLIINGHEGAWKYKQCQVSSLTAQQSERVAGLEAGKADGWHKSIKQRPEHS